MVEHALLFRTESNFYFISYVYNMIIHLSNVKKADMQNKKKEICQLLWLLQIL